MREVFLAYGTCVRDINLIPMHGGLYIEPSTTDRLGNVEKKNFNENKEVEVYPTKLRSTQIQRLCVHCYNFVGWPCYYKEHGRDIFGIMIRAAACLFCIGTNSAVINANNIIYEHIVFDTFTAQ